MPDTDMVVFDRNKEIAELQAENKRLARALQDANVRADRAREDADRALGSLRQQLSPLYQALQGVFGELDAAGVSEMPASDSGVPTVDARTKAVWDSWKTKLGGQCAKVIDVLLTHGEMNTTQLGIAVGTRRQNIPNLIYKLNQAGLINKNGSGRFSLKQV